MLRAVVLFCLATVLSLLVAGCNVSKDERVENTLSFDRIADTLKKFDSVVIILKSQGGVLIDSVYHAKVNQTSDVQKLKAPHWDGSKVIVAVFGIKDGKLIYQVETILDPVTGSRDSSVILTPDASLSSTVQSLTLLVGDSLGLPAITVSPGNLLNKVLDWSVSPPELLEIGTDYLKARQAGSGTITVRLKANPDILFNIAVNISTSGVVPDSIDIQPDSLTVAVGGAPGSLSAKVFPSAAPSAVDWKSTDTSIATVDAAGRVFGKAQGNTSIWASSQVRPKITASVLVTVTGAVPVQSVAFSTDSLEIRMNGPAADLAVSVLPTNSNQAVTYTISDPTKASIQNGKISGTQTGNVSVIATSVANPAAKDTLYVKISGPLAVTSVSFAKDSLSLLVAGAPESLVVSVLPSGADPAVTFTLSDPAKASIQNGKISGTQTGNVSVIATSVANPAAKDTLYVKISGPLAVTKVSFAKDSLDILVGGAAESLMVSVLPAGADPTVTFTVSDPAKASIQKGKITGTAAGQVSVIAASVSNPAAKDTLIVKITVPTPNDTIPPNKPIVHVTPAGPTRNLKPVWSWSSGGGGGAGSYQTSLDKATFDPNTPSVTDTTYTPTANLSAGSHVLYVRERDAAGNWSLPGSAQVDLDTTAPSAPKLVGTSPTSALPRWTWSSGGGGGAGIYRSRLADANFPANAPESADSAYALTTATSGTTYTLYVEERDAAGNWSAPSNLAIKYDLTKPTVTIALPQASGTFITSSATVAVSGTSTGPNAIAKVEYTLDAGTPSAATLGTNGAWSIASLSIANGQTTTITVTATDNLGNTGQAQLKVLRDSDIPLPPTALVKPTSPTNVAASSWSWAAGADGATGSGLNGNYRWKLNAGGWTETTTASASGTGTTLAEGTNTFSVEEQDKAGNWSDPLTGTVVLDTKVPDAVTFVGIDGTLTADDTPTWSWTPSTTNGGIGQYVLKLDAGAEFDGGTAVSYTPVTPLADNATHTLTVKEKDQVPGVVGTAKSFSYKIKVNPPAAPTVKSAVASLVSGSLTNNPGFSWTSGGGGNGKYRVKVNTETSYRVNGVAQTTFSLGSGDADGTYTVAVSEQDDLGRYGTEGTFTIKLDRTAPVFTNAIIVGKTYALRDNFITNVSNLAISYKSDGVSKSFPCTLADNAATVCKDAPQTDAAGNTATFQRTIWRRSNVVFFTPTGTGDGSSWEDAASDIQAQVDAGSDGKDFWLANGDFTAKNDQLTIWGMTLNLTGGFFAETYPTNTSGRNKGGTTLAAVSTMGTYGTWDGIKFVASSSGLGLGLSLGSDASPAKIIDCQFKANVDVVLGGNLTFQNCQMIGVKSNQPLNISGNYTVVWDGGAIQNNQSTSNNYAIAVSGVNVSFKGALTISGNASMFSTIQMYNDGALDIASSVTFSCSELQNGPDASGHCKGALIVPGP